MRSYSAAVLAALGGVFVVTCRAHRTPALSSGFQLPRVLAMIWATSGWAASGRR